MKRKLLACLLTATALICAQPRRVDPKNTYSRVIAIVGLIGTGAPSNPKRPEYAPWPTATAQSGITAFYWVPTDSGTSAVVEFTARDLTALRQILADKTLTVFIRGRDSKSTIETAIQKVKKTFTLDNFGIVQ